MARLAEYMQQLAKLLGETPSVHFERVEKGSVALVSKVTGTAAGRVSARVGSLRGRRPTGDVSHAYEVLNRMVAEDNTTALLREGARVVVRFPGQHAQPQTTAIKIPDTGWVVGYLYMLSDGGKGFQARIRLESGGVLMCEVAGDVAKKLREHLFETVKVFGSGVWERSSDGAWSVLSLKIADVVKVDSSSLRSLVDQLRRLEVEWPDDPVAEQLSGHGGLIQ